VVHGASSLGLTDQALEHIGHEDEQVRGGRILLAQAVPAADPVPGYPVKKDSRETRAKNIIHPAALTVVEAAGPKDGKEALPVNRVERFLEVNFKNNG
jgi:hypothetical protein